MIVFKEVVGSTHDLRELTVEIPMQQSTIGVFVSGGIDSALLYYLIKKYNNNKFHRIIPFVIDRFDTSIFHATNVINYVNNVTQHITHPYIITINERDSNKQVRDAFLQIKNLNLVDILYIGVIEILDIHKKHVINYPNPLETDYVKFPLQKLNKSHVIDCILKLKQNFLFKITHSCVYDTKCNNCNRCNERLWGFNELGLQDPGKI